MDEIDKYSREALATERSYRRDRRHNIFAWCSSILVASIGASAAVAQNNKTLTPPQRWLISFTIVTLAVYGGYWINHHWTMESNIQRKIDCLEKKLLMISIQKKEYPADILSILAIALLSILAIGTVWSASLPIAVIIVVAIGLLSLFVAAHFRPSIIDNLISATRQPAPETGRSEGAAGKEERT